MSSFLPSDSSIVGACRYDTTIHDADLRSAWYCARARGLPLAYFYAETDTMAEAIVTFWLLNQTDQRKVLADLKKKVFTPPKKPAKG